MYIITSKTSNDIAFEVIKNSNKSIVHLTKKFQVTSSEEITDSIQNLINLGLVSSAFKDDKVIPEKKDEIPTEENTPQVESNELDNKEDAFIDQPTTPKRGRRSNNNNEKEE